MYHNQQVSIAKTQAECKRRGRVLRVKDKPEGIREMGMTKNSILEQNKHYFIGHTGILISTSQKSK